MRSNKGLIAAASIGAMIMAGTALADPPRALRVGGSAQGTLGGSDAKSDDKSFYEDYTIQLAQGQAVEFVMTSEAFDSYLHFGRGVGEDFESLKSDDDGAGGQNARVKFVATEAGAYTIRANALSEGMTGAYALSAKAYTPPPPATPKAIEIGSTVNGRLADGGARAEDSDRLYDLYTFSGTEGDRIAITMRSADFDSVLKLSKSGEEEAVAEDDDGGGETNARILTALPSSGAFEIVASSFEPTAGGGYSIAFERLPPAGPAPRVKPLQRGRIVKGEFTLSSPVFEGFRPYDLYSVRGRAGETVTVLLQAENFDAFIEAGSTSPAGFGVVASDDDSGGGTNAKREIKFDQSGVMVLRPSPLGQGATGSYTISVLE